MRIVDVCAFYAPQGGGVKTYVERKLRAARDQGHEVIIVAPGDHDALIAEGDGGCILSVEAPKFPLDRRYHYFDDEPALHALLDRLQPDVVEASSPWASPGMVARWPGAKRTGSDNGAFLSLVMHADPLSAYAYRWFGPVASRERIDKGFEFFWRHLRRLDEQFDMVVSASQSLSARLTAGGLRKVRTIPMGVSPGVFSPGLRSEPLRRRMLERCELGADATLLVGLGRLASEKRWPMVIEAVIAAGYAHPVGLVLLGDGRDRARVIRAAANNPHVMLGAPVTDRYELATILASADALVHGCEAETFCMVAAEARASGVPLIVPDMGGASDQFARRQGQTYRACSAGALAAAIGRFIDEDPAAQRARATEAAPRVMEMDEHFRRLFGIYQQAIDGLADVA